MLRGSAATSGGDVARPAAGAQEGYPSRPVKFVVPFPAGGPLDVKARLVGQKLTEQWGKPVLIENQVGGSGSIGANAVARAAPDGHTLLVTVDIPLTMYPAVAKQLPYNPRTRLPPHCERGAQRQYLLLGRDRRACAFRGRAVQGDRRRRHGARALQRRGAGDDRGNDRRGQHDVRSHSARRAARAQREAEGARRHRAVAIAAAARCQAARRAGLPGTPGVQLVRRAGAGQDA